MKTWLAKVENGKPKFSDYTGMYFRDWCKENEGKGLRIEPLKKPVSENLRGYYFAAVVPLVQSTCDEWKDLTSDQMHDVIKKLFNFFETYNPVTKRNERFGRSVMSDDEWNNTEKAMRFMEPISEYLASCGLEMPDSEQYKTMRDIEVLRRQDYQKPSYHYPESTGDVIF